MMDKEELKRELPDLSLSKDEEVLWHGKATLKSGTVIAVLLLLFWTVIIPIYVILRIRSMRYVITSKKVWKKVGIIGKETWSVPWGKVTDWSTEMGIMAKLLDYREITFQTAGAPTPEIIFGWLKDYTDVTALVEEKIK